MDAVELISRCNFIRHKKLSAFGVILYPWLRTVSLRGCFWSNGNDWFHSMLSVMIMETRLILFAKT